MEEDDIISIDPERQVKAYKQRIFGEDVVVLFRGKWNTALDVIYLNPSAWKRLKAFVE